MPIALTHLPSPALGDCELTYLPPRPIDAAEAGRQHRAYRRMLESCGAQVLALDGNLALPDSVFVEDTALVLDEIAVLTPMGVASRRPESELIEAELQKHRQVVSIPRPAKLEGGDILRIGRRLMVGLSTRSDRAGADALETLVAPYGYRVEAARVPGCLHLKTGCTALDDDTVLINPAWVDTAPFEDLEILSVPEDEPFAANILRIGDTLCMHAGFDKTRQLVEGRGYTVVTTDISEFLKAEAGLTCMSLLFEPSQTAD